MQNKSLKPTDDACHALRGNGKSRAMLRRLSSTVLRTKKGEMKKVKCIHKSFKLLILWTISIFPNEIHAQIVVDNIQIESHIYKTRGLKRLELTVFQQADRESDKNLPAIIFFHGGGLRERHIWEFRPLSKYLVDSGMVAIVATYTVKRHGRTIYESIADAKSAIRWVREHADEFGIDVNLLAAGGGSAGGYLAACAALIKEYDEPHEDMRISSVPNALVLFSPRLVISGIDSLTKKELRYNKGRKLEDISPVHNVFKGAPPTIVFRGTADSQVGMQEAQWFCEEMNKYGNSCELVKYEGREHGFHNYFHGTNPDFFSTMETTVKFLSKLGYVSKDNY